MSLCPCGSNNDFTQCCEPFLSGKKSPQTPEQLMRSRYTAFVRENLEYIAATMQPPASENFDSTNNHKVDWVKLEVLNASQTNSTGLVEFNAYFRENHTLMNLHEISIFQLLNNKWYYTDHREYEVSKINIGRNDPCLCGSGKKFKKCCGL